MRKSNLRFVVDTNVLISALLTPNGPARQAFTKADRNGVFLISGQTLAELEKVIYRKKFDKYITDKERDRFLRDFLAKSIPVRITESIAVCSDPDDDKFVELAVSGGADYVITGNRKHFPESPFRDNPILRAAEFLKLDLS